MLRLSAVQYGCSDECVHHWNCLKYVENRQRESEGGCWKQLPFFTASLQKHELLPASRGVLGRLVGIFRGVFVERK